MVVDGRAAMEGLRCPAHMLRRTQRWAWRACLSGARAAAHFTAAAFVNTQVPVEKRLRLDYRAQDTQRGGASGKLEGRRWRLLMLGRATYIIPVTMGEPGSERLTAAAASSCEQRPGASSALGLAEQPRLVALAAARLAVTHPSPWPPPAPPLPPDLAASSCTCRPPWHAHPALRSHSSWLQARTCCRRRHVGTARLGCCWPASLPPRGASFCLCRPPLLAAVQAAALPPQMSARLQRLWERHQRAAEGVDTIRVLLACDAEGEGEEDGASQAHHTNGQLLLEGPASAQPEVPPEGQQTAAAAAQPGNSEGGNGAAAQAVASDAAAAEAQPVSAAENGDAAAGSEAGDAALAVSKQIAFMSPLIQVGACACWLLMAAAAGSAAVRSGHCWCDASAALRHELRLQQAPPAQPDSRTPACSLVTVQSTTRFLQREVLQSGTGLPGSPPVRLPKQASCCGWSAAVGTLHGGCSRHLAWGRVC